MRCCQAEKRSMKKYLILLAGFAMLGMIACKKEKLTAEELHDVLSVTGPTTGVVNTDLSLIVTYPYTNGCDYIGRFEEAKNGNIITVKAYSKPISKDAVCTQDVGTRTTEYKFKATAARSYELRFLNRNGNSVNHTVTIQ